MIGFGLGDRLEQLRGIGAHGDLGHVHVAVGHRHHAQILLLGALACRGELGDRAGRGGLGGLSAGVGVHLGVEHQDVDVLILCEHVVYSAVADVVGPAVAAEDPLTLLDQQVLVLEHGFAQLAVLGQRGEQLRGSGLAGFALVLDFEPLIDGLDQLLLAGVGFLDLEQVLGELLSSLGGGEEHAVTELGIVLEEAVGPGGAVAVFVHGVGAGRGAAAVDGGAARGVRDQHPVAEELGNELDVGRFAAAGARAAELEQGLFELAVLYGLHVQFALELRQRLGEFPVGFLRALGAQGLHRQRLFLGGADVYAVFAAGAVQHADLHPVGKALELGADGGLGLKGGGGLLEIGFADQVGTDGGVRADQRAVAALDALVDVPLGNLDRDAALLVLGGAGGHGAVHAERGHGQLVAFLREDRGNDGVEVLGGLDLYGHGALGGGRPLGGDLHFVQAADGHVDGRPVHLDDLVALLGVALLGVGLHVLIRLVVGDDVGQLEERSLHDGVDAAAHADLLGQLDGVDGIEPGVLLRQQLLHGSGQLLLHLLGRPGAVEQEGAAVLQRGHHVVLGDIGRVVAGDEVGAVDQIGALDRVVAEAQVADGDAAGLLGVIGEVGLRVLVGVVADDLDGVLVGADGAVRAQAVEHAADGALGGDVQRLAQRQAGLGHVVVDADGEVVLGGLLGDVVEHGLDHGGVELLGAQAVAAADHGDVLLARFDQRGAHVLVQGLAQGAGFLGPVQNRDGLAGLGDGLEEVLDAEGTVQVHLDQAHLLALGGQVIHGLLDGVAAGAHGDDDVLGVGRADVIEEVILSAGELADLLHALLDDRGSGDVVLVGGFSALEVDVGVLGGAGLVRMLGIERAGAERLDLVPRDDLCDVLVGDVFDLLDLMAGAEAVEEVKEGHRALERGKVRDQRHILRFLHAVARQHRKAGLAAGHDVAVVAEDAQRVVGQRSGADVEHRGQLLAGDLVHVGDHQQKALGGGEGGGQRAGDQGAVHSARGAGFGLHLGDFDLLAEQVHSALRSPLVRDLRHGRGGRDGINGRHIAESIRDMADSGIAVYCLFDAQEKDLLK